MKKDPSETVLEEIAMADPELAVALEYDLIDAEATLYADRIGLPNLSTLELF